MLVSVFIQIMAKPAGYNLLYKKIFDLKDFIWWKIVLSFVFVVAIPACMAMARQEGGELL